MAQWSKKLWTFPRNIGFSSNLELAWVDLCGPTLSGGVSAAGSLHQCQLPGGVGPKHEVSTQCHHYYRSSYINPMLGYCGSLRLRDRLLETPLDLAPESPAIQADQQPSRLIWLSAVLFFYGLILTYTQSFQNPLIQEDIINPGTNDLVPGLTSSRNSISWKS